MRFGILASLMLLASVARADFALDVDPAEIRKTEASPAIIDLGVGEKGYVRSPLFCSNEGALQIVGLSSLGGIGTDYAAVYEIRRDPNNRVTVTIMVGSKSATTVHEEIVNTLTRVRPCDALKFPEAERLTVSTINGKASTSQLLAR